MVRYLYRADDLLRQHGYRKPLLVTHSSGGAARVAKTTALNTYNSGPVVGLMGCSEIADGLYGIQDFVSVDVGGTSVDIGLCVGGKVRPEREPDVEGFQTHAPTASRLARIVQERCPDQSATTSADLSPRLQTPT